MNIRILTTLFILIGITGCVSTPPPMPAVWDESNTTVTVEKRINTSQAVKIGACGNATVEGDVCYDTGSNTLKVNNGTALEVVH